ncbi:hypothetical protein [uncultured Nostoc sp.]|uniref:hypothetical protein n=1 Tax=uncultured Nostoc sp. TaxID=340711 RepID=UPI0035C9B1FA
MLQIDKNNYYQKLLTLTLSNASNIPLYSKQWTTNIAQKVQNQEDLRLLPLILREVYQSYMESNSNQPESVKVVHHTRGTTGKLLYRYRTNEELQFLSEFFIKLQESSIDQGISRKRIILNQTDGHHGTSIPIPTGNLVINLSNDYWGILHFMDMVQKQFDIAGCEPKASIISGFNLFIVLCTLALIKNGINPKDTDVKLIFSGGFLSSASRKFMKDTWEATLIDNFSLSEVFGSAPLCPICERYSFEPTVIAEFLDPFSKEPVENGLAVLVLTELYPFVRYHPLVRYWTDDLVWVEKSTCACRHQVFWPKGRFCHALLDSTLKPETILLTSLELFEALEETPEIVWTPPHPYEWITQMFGSIPRGKPHVSLFLELEDRGKKRIVLNFEYPFSISFHHDNVKKVEAELAQRLLRHSPSLQKATTQGEYELIVNACQKLNENLGYFFW